jgi:hypothetical protein
MGIIRRNHTKKSSVSKEIRIASLKNELSLCKKKIKKLKSTPTDGFSKIELMTLERDLAVEIQRKEVLQGKLTTLGITEKRGRPRKDDSEKYLTTRNKFTAMLLPNNLSYLQELKNSKKISNISSFLDSLIENHRTLHE